MPLQRVNDSVKDDFFDQEYDRLTSQYQWLQASLETVAKKLRVYSALDKVSIRFSFEGREIHFHLLKGPMASANEISIDLPYSLFRQLLFIDFGQLLTAEMFLAQFLAQVHAQSRMSRGDLKRLHDVALMWYDVSYEAARSFFESSRLRNYFHNSPLVMGWWNEHKLIEEKHRRYTDMLCGRIQSKDKQLVDIGCGLGRFDCLYQQAQTSVLIDISHPMLRRARARLTASNVYYCQADIHDLPLGPAFDVVLAMQIMMHIPEPFALLGKLGKSIMSGGSLWTDFTCSTRLATHFRQESFFTRLYSEAYVRQQCKAHGFCVRDAFRLKDREETYWLAIELTR